MSRTSWWSAPSPDLRTVADLIALGKSKDLTYATPGAGSIAHLAAELLARSAGFPVIARALSRRHAGADRRAAAAR